MGWPSMWFPGNLSRTAEISQQGREVYPPRLRVMLSPPLPLLVEKRGTGRLDAGMLIESSKLPLCRSML